MMPITLLATNKLMNLLTTTNALAQVVSADTASAGVSIPPLNSNQVTVSAISPDLGDRDLQLSYPRVCVYASQVANQQREKFRGFSGTVSVVAEVWSSASLEQASEQALHFYVEGVVAVLRANIGDWGNGMRYSGIYDVQMQAPRIGGFGFVQSARVSCTLEASFN